MRSYLGEGKEAKEFAKQFLEQRSKLRQLQRSVQQYEEDNLSVPAKAVNPGQASDFHEVKVNSFETFPTFNSTQSKRLFVIFPFAVEIEKVEEENAES